MATEVQDFFRDTTLVTVVTTRWYGSEALELTYKTAAGRVANELLYRHDEPRIEVVEQGRPWSFDGDGAIFRLVSEAHRIRLAHLFDPLLAVHTPLIEPLPQSEPHRQKRTTATEDECIGRANAKQHVAIVGTVEAVSCLKARWPESLK